MNKAEIIASGRDLYTQTRLTAFRNCPRKHYLQFVVGLKQNEDKKALRMGSAFHLGQEELAKIPPGLEDGKFQDLVDQAVLVAIAGYKSTPPGSMTETEWSIEQEVVGRLLQGYVWRWRKEPLEVLHGEVTFKQPIKNVESGGNVFTSTVDADGMPVRIDLQRAGMIDKIVRTADGRVGILEHKTTGDSIKPASDYWVRAKMSSQVTFYYRAAMDSPDLPDPQFILFDVIRKPSIEPSKLKAQDFRDFLGISYRKGKKTVVQPDPEKLHKYCGEEFDVQVNGKIDLEEPENTVIESVAIDGAVAEFTKTGNQQTIVETPSMYGARLMEDMLNRPEMYFAREEIPRLQNDLDEFDADVHQTAEMVSFCTRTGQWPKNTMSCINPWRCEFLNLCSNNVQVTVGGEIPAGYVRPDWVHPELEDKMKGNAQ